MRMTVTLLTLAALMGATLSHADSDRIAEAERLAVGPQGPRIVGGERIPIAERPWQVALLLAHRADDFHAQFCGGSLIDPSWVLTAAHCVDGQTPASAVEVLVGTDRLNGSGDRVGVRRIVIHPSWDPASKENDIALLELVGSLRRQPVIGLADEQQLDAAARVLVSGWGRTRELGRRSEALLGVELDLQTLETCNRRDSYDGAVTERMICAGRPGGGQDSCTGDSGGPAAITAGGETLLAGIVSWGDGCARAKKYGIYTRAPLYGDWIQAIWAGGDAPAGAGDAPAGADVPGERTASDLILHCEVSCSQEKLRTGVARVTWVAREPQLRAAGVAPESFSRPTLDASVFKGRFDPGHYATFPGLEPEVGARSAEPAGEARLGPAYNLQMTSYRAASSNERALASASADPQDAVSAQDAVVIEGLAPGMTYTWRLRFPVDGGFVESATVSCEAPICPADLAREE